jgi:hypothetical protein
MTLRRLCLLSRRCARVYVSVRLSSLCTSCVRSHHPSRNTSTWDIIRTGYADGPDESQWYSVFDRDLRFDLRVHPVLTTKRVFVRGVTEELLWMISGRDAGALAWG